MVAKANYDSDLSLRATAGTEHEAFYWLACLLAGLRGDGPGVGWWLHVILGLVSRCS